MEQDVEPSEAPIVVAGDLHGNLQWARHLIRAAYEAGARTIYQLGDLGVLYPGKGKGRFDAKLDRYLSTFDMELVFIDGNHDSHTELRRLPDTLSGLSKVLPRISYLPRGGRTVVQGMTVGGLGGAYSVDSRFRVPHVDWWPGIEEVEPADVERLIAGGPVDVLLTHDVPAAVPMTSKWHDLDAETIARAQVSRDLLQRAVDSLQPRQVFSGHWHTRQTSFIGEHFEVRCDVLDMDGSKDGNAVLVWPGDPLRIETLRVGGHNNPRRRSQ